MIEKILLAQLHLFLAKELGDPVGETTARINIQDLKKVLNVPDSSDTESLVELQQKLMKKTQNTSTTSSNTSSRLHRMRRQSMEQLDLIKLTPDGKKQQSVDIDNLPSRNNENKPAKEEDFFEMLSRTQSKRMDDQRCTLKSMGASVDAGTAKDRRPLMQQNNNKDSKALLEMIADFQCERMDEQRCTMLPGFKRSDKNPAPPPIGEASGSDKPDESEPFFDMLMRCQGSRYEEQRSELPKNNIVLDQETNEANNAPARNQTNTRSTLPDEDFFSLIMRVQGGRMEDQRVSLPSVKPKK
jgi:G-protein signaling modulator 2